MVLSVMWAMTAAMVGFSLGRVSMYGQTVYEEGTDEGGRESEAKSGQSGQGNSSVQSGHVQSVHAHPDQTERKIPVRRKGKRGEPDTVFWSVGSPVSGEVTAQREGEQPAVIIHPDGDKLYAPSGGKITRVFPMGNAFLFTTEFGTELYIQAGEAEDELMVRYYRPRILQNEVVGKGKLLLEFDRTGLEAEGISTDVSVSVENSVYGGNIKMNVGARVKTGEEILQVRGA